MHLEKTVKEVSNRYSINEAVNVVSSLDYQSVVKVSNESKNKSDDKTDLELFDFKNDDEDHDQIKMPSFEDSLEEQFMAENFYSSSINYEEAVSQPTLSGIDLEEFYAEGEKIHKIDDTTAETMSNEEAQEYMSQVQYATMLGTINDLPLEERKKLANWMTFNQTMMKIFEAEAITRDVNYSMI
jgi:hypothetical protein